MTAKQQKATIMRGVRMPQELNAVLEKDARAQNRSVSAVIVSILTKYAEWDRFGDTLGLVTIPEEAFDLILEAANDEALNAIAAGAGSRMKELTLLWYGETNARTVLIAITTWFKYSGLGRCEIEENDRNYRITLHHDLGSKYRNFMRCYFDHAIRTALGTVAEIETTGNLVIVRFSAP